MLRECEPWRYLRACAAPERPPLRASRDFSRVTSRVEHASPEVSLAQRFRTGCRIWPRCQRAWRRQRRCARPHALCAREGAPSAGPIISEQHRGRYSPFDITHADVRSTYASRIRRRCLNSCAGEGEAILAQSTVTSLAALPHASVRPPCTRAPPERIVRRGICWAWAAAQIFRTPTLQPQHPPPRQMPTARAVSATPQSPRAPQCAPPVPPSPHA